MRAICVEYLPSQVTYDVVGDLGALPLDDKSDKLSQIGGQVLLIVQQFDNLRVVVALEELDLTAILLHAQL